MKQQNYKNIKNQSNRNNETSYRYAINLLISQDYF